MTYGEVNGLHHKATCPPDYCEVKTSNIIDRLSNARRSVSPAELKLGQPKLCGHRRRARVVLPEPADCSAVRPDQLCSRHQPGGSVRDAQTVSRGKNAPSHIHRGELKSMQTRIFSLSLSKFPCVSYASVIYIASCLGTQGH